MLKFFILFILATGAVFYLYMGFHNSIKVNKTTLPHKVILFKEYSGDYRNIDKAIQTMEGEIAKLGTKNYQEFGMYYDDPNLLENPNQARAIIGVLLDIKERHLGANFLVNHVEYRISESEPLDCLSSSFVYRNQLSLTWIISKVYPALVEYGKTNKLFTKGNTVGALEIYHYKTAGNNIEVLFPYGQGVDKMQLHRAPKPIYKRKDTDL